MIALGADSAMLNSSFIGRTVDFPLAAKGYETHLRKLITGSRFEKRVVKADGGRDMATSFGCA